MKSVRTYNFIRQWLERFELLVDTYTSCCGQNLEGKLCDSVGKTMVVIRVRCDAGLCVETPNIVRPSSKSREDLLTIV